MSLAPPETYQPAPKPLPSQRVVLFVCVVLVLCFAAAVGWLRFTMVQQLGADGAISLFLCH